MPTNDNKISILAIYNDPDGLDLIQTVLNTQGYEVILAKSAKEALSILESGINPDLVVCEVNMRDIDGFEFYSQIQKRPGKNRLPFIFLNAMDEKYAIAQVKELGAEDYLMSPWSYKDLLSSIKGILIRRNELNASYNEQIASTKDRILKMLSHEFRTPLATITGFSKVLSEDFDKLTGNQLKDFVDLILQSSKRLTSLVEDFIQSSSIETGECEKVYSNTKQEENINYLIENILNNYRGKFFEKRFSIKKNFTDEPVYALICSSQISIVIKKILDNAIKFCYDNSIIEVSIINKEDVVEISIKNSGDGIPFDQRDKIFDKFYQINREVQEQQGSGLGLFIATKLASINKCTIEFESVEKSHTIFKINIPVIKE